MPSPSSPTTISLPPSHGGSAQAGQGRLFSFADGLLRVTGPPIQITAFRLDQDRPRWRSVPPQLVVLHGPRLQRWLNAESPAGARLKRDIAWLYGLLGKDLMPSVLGLPRTAKPFLMVWLAHRVPYFRKLLIKSPFLAVLIAHRHARHGIVGTTLVEKVQQDARRPRRELMQHLGLPASSHRTLTRCRPTAADPRKLAGLQRSLGLRHLLKVWRHLPVVSRDTFRMLVNPRIAERLGEGFLRHTADMDPMGHGMNLYEIFLDMLLLEDQAGLNIPTGVFDHPAQLLKWHTQLPPHPRKRELRRLLRTEFRPSPLSDTGQSETIRQIRSGQMLLREAFALSHCATNYARLLSNGMSYMYAVYPDEGLERCTVWLSLRHNEQGHRQLELVEVRGPRNARVEPATEASLRAWLKQAHPGTGAFIQ